MWKINTLCQCLLVSVAAFAACVLHVVPFDRLRWTDCSLLLATGLLVGCCWVQLVYLYALKSYFAWCHPRCSSTGCKGVVVMVKRINGSIIDVPLCAVCADRKDMWMDVRITAVPEPSGAPPALKARPNAGLDEAQSARRGNVNVTSPLCAAARAPPMPALAPARSANSPPSQRG
jgi:hypothetical protein